MPKRGKNKQKLNGMPSRQKRYGPPGKKAEEARKWKQKSEKPKAMTDGNKTGGRSPEARPESTRMQNRGDFTMGIQIKGMAGRTPPAKSDKKTPRNPEHMGEICKIVTQIEVKGGQRLTAR